jgi:hypothetical protein
MRKTTFGALLMIILFSCTKHEAGPHDSKPVSNYPNGVLDKWIVLQVRLMRDATGIPNNAFARPYAYSGIAAYESIAPGLSDESLKIRWNGLSTLPQADKWKLYFWPESLNSAMAEMNRKFFPKASPADSMAIDSLQAAIQASFTENPLILQLSRQFGRSIADAIFNWAETDGYKHASDPYTAPIGPGLWTPTPPAFANASTPYWGNNRPTIAGSLSHAPAGPPPFPYSTDPSSNFFKMVKRVYDASQTLTPDQTAMALWWRDIPGVSSPGHWLSILHQVLQQTNARLERSALAYALTGAVLNDAAIAVFKDKYIYNQVRPITYIRGVMGFPTWNSLLTTPAHPEYPSAHASISSASAVIFTDLFGNIGTFTDHTYDYLGWAPRSFPSFKAIGIDAGNSRVYAGIHYQPSIDSGLVQGNKVGNNMWRLVHNNSGGGGGGDSKSDN